MVGREMVKIAVIMANMGVSPEEIEERRKHLFQVVHPQTTIDFFKNAAGLAAIESQLESAVAPWRSSSRPSAWRKPFPRLSFIAAGEALARSPIGVRLHSCGGPDALLLRHGINLCNHFGAIPPLAKNFKSPKQRIYTLLEPGCGTSISPVWNFARIWSVSWIY